MTFTVQDVTEAMATGYHRGSDMEEEIYQYFFM